MTTPIGYKETEIGRIPDDWTVVSIGDVIDVFDGTHQTPHYVEIGVPFYSVENVTADNFNDTKFISEAEHTLLTKKVKIEKGDILMTRIGAIGDCKYIDWDVKASYYVSLALLKKKSNAISMKWFAIMSGGKQFKASILANSLQFAVPMKINLGDISKVKFALPPLDEQVKIADQISSIDNLLSHLEIDIQKKKQVKEGLMQQLLTGKIRLPGFEGEWASSTLNDVCNITKGTQFNSSALIENGKYPMLNGGTEPSGYSDYYNTEADTITISEGGNSCGYVNYLKTRFWCGGHCYTVKEYPCINKLFFYQCLKYNENQIMKLRVGTGLPNIQVKALLSYAISYPIDINEQISIATILSDIDNEIHCLEDARDKYILIKHGMMQELLTGKIRLQ